MFAAIMTGTCAAGHKTHPNPPLFFAHITILFSFRFWHHFSSIVIFLRGNNMRVRPVPEGTCFEVMFKMFMLPGEILGTERVQASFLQ
jgi:hypothetical protein